MRASTIDGWVALATLLIGLGCDRAAQRAAPASSLEAGLAAAREDAHEAALAKARECWRQGQVEEPKDLLRCITPTAGSEICLTPIATGCETPATVDVWWAAELRTAAGARAEHRLRIGPTSLSHFDVDGDGTEELIVSGHPHGTDARGGERSFDGVPRAETFGVEILRVRGERLEPVSTMPPPPSWMSATGGALLPPTMVRDEDGDGRPDLVFERFFEVRLYDWDTTTYALTGPPVVARLRGDGTFSFDEPGVLEHLRRGCEHVPPLRAATHLQLHPAAVCARVRGVSLAATESAYLARCRSLAPPKTAVYPSEHIATCTRGPNAAERTNGVPDEVHAVLAAMERPVPTHAR